MSKASELKLERLAKLISNAKRKVTPMQVAAQLLEEALGHYVVLDSEKH